MNCPATHCHSCPKPRVHVGPKQISYVALWGKLSGEGGWHWAVGSAQPADVELSRGREVFEESAILCGSGVEQGSHLAGFRRPGSSGEGLRSPGQPCFAAELKNVAATWRYVGVYRAALLPQLLQ